MASHNPYSSPAARVSLLSNPVAASRNWRRYRFRTTAGIGIALTIIGFTAGPRGILISGVVGFPVAFLITLLASSIAVAVAEKHLSSDRAAFLGAACGFVSGLISIAVRVVPLIRWPIALDGALLVFLFFAIVIYGGAGAVGGWVGSMSWSEGEDRARARKTTTRLWSREPEWQKTNCSRTSL